MSQTALVLGVTVGPFEDRLDATRIGRFAEATGDPDPLVVAGTLVPAGAAVLLAWGAQNAARDALVPQRFQDAAAGGVHGEHDLVLHRPLRPGEPLMTRVEGWGARPAGRNSVVTLRYTTMDPLGRLVAEQWWSTVWIDVVCRADGDPTPDHTFPGAARTHPVGSWTTEVDEDMARRYAEVSGDWSAHHFDTAAARRSGSDRPFLHGLCTLALCTRAVSETLAHGDAARIRRMAVRFARPMPLGKTLEVQFFGIEDGSVAFEARCGESVIVSNGRAELS